MSELASVLAPASVEAGVLAQLGWVLIVGAGVVFVIVLAALLLALLRPRAWANAVPVRWWVLGAGIAFPVAVLSVLLVYATVRTVQLDRAAADPALVVSVTGRLWWWELRYRDPASGREVSTANELRLPAGRRVHLGLQSHDVIHSLWVPGLGGKMDLVPGRVNRLMVTALRPGVYRGQCAEFCGLQHARMALHVVVMAPAEFDAWLASQARPAPSAPPAAGVQAGRQAFERHGCAVCHAVEAAASAPRLGPNLAGVSQRRHLGAGVLANSPSALRRWPADVQALKPGAQMPSYAWLDSTTLDALGAYLESLP